MPRTLEAVGESSKLILQRHLSGLPIPLLEQAEAYSSQPCGPQGAGGHLDNTYMLYVDMCPSGLGFRGPREVGHVLEFIFFACLWILRHALPYSTSLGAHQPPEWVPTELCMSVQSPLK